MKALCWHGKKDVRVESVPDPKILNPGHLITHRLPLDEAPHGYAMFNNKQDECIKVVLKP